MPDVDLVARLFGCGRAGRASLDLAHALLREVGGVAGLARAELDDLEPWHRRMPGLSRRRAALLAAALELGRRAVGRPPERGQRLGAAHEVYEHLRARLSPARTEEFWILGLDVRHRLIFETCIARGSLTSVEVHPREVFRPLIRAAAAATILCHNHPSGDPTPSHQDLELTTRLKAAGALCGITVLDHVVVGAEGYVSLAERGWL